jgi:hypothetical protein
MLGPQRAAKPESGITLAEAKAWCQGNAACVSFERMPTAGSFQFSTSCTVSVAVASSNLFDLHVIDRTTAGGKLLDGHSIGNNYQRQDRRTDANFVKAETEFKGAVNGFTGANMPFMTKAMKMRYNKVLEEDAKRDTPALAAKTPYTISALFLGERTTQGSCPATVPTFANGVNGAKVVGKGAHGAHDENMSGSTVPVDCADGFTATPEGSNPLVFQRREPVAHSHIDGACTTDFNPTDDKNTANCPAAQPQCVEWATAPSQKRCQRGRSTGYAWVNHGTCDAVPDTQHYKLVITKTHGALHSCATELEIKNAAGNTIPATYVSSDSCYGCTCLTAEHIGEKTSKCSSYGNAQNFFDGDDASKLWQNIPPSEWWCSAEISKKTQGSNHQALYIHS